MECIASMCGYLE